MRAFVRRHVLLAIAVPTLWVGLQAAPPSIGIAVVQAAPWSPGDTTRDGATELAIAIRIAHLQRAHSSVGLVCVGDRHGMLGHGGERALRRAVLSGVVVVRIARRGDVAATPDELFLDGGALDAIAVERILADLLPRYGSPPAAAQPDQATERELAAIRAHFEPFRQALAVERGSRIAANQ